MTGKRNSRCRRRHRDRRHLVEGVGVRGVIAASRRRSVVNRKCVGEVVVVCVGRSHSLGP